MSEFSSGSRVQVEATEESFEELAEKARQGSAVAFERIVHGLQDRIYNYLFQMLRSEQDAEDVAQETFVKVYKHLQNFDGRARFTTWVYSIAKNTALNHLRSRKTHEPIEAHEAYLSNPPEKIDVNERESIWTAARKLKPKMFEMLWLFYGEGFSVQEIAEISSMHPVSVRVLLYRARTALKKKYQRQETIR